VPEFEKFCASIGMPHRKVSDVADFEAALADALACDGPQLIEVDMCAIGPFGEAFAGPPAGSAQKAG
jgi:acetolactate synthase-1/2/3 large subunit